MWWPLVPAVVSRQQPFTVSFSHVFHSRQESSHHLQWYRGAQSCSFQCQEEILSSPGGGTCKLRPTSESNCKSKFRWERRQLWRTYQGVKGKIASPFLGLHISVTADSSGEDWKLSGPSHREFWENKSPSNRRGGETVAYVQHLPRFLSIDPTRAYFVQYDS